jgi:lipopolysaccharide biosynthesis glycosyltransferase
LPAIRNAVDAAATRVRARLQPAVLRAAVQRRPATAPAVKPTPADGAAVERAAVEGNDALEGNDVFGDFFRTLAVDGEFDRAAVVFTRRLIARGQAKHANSIAQVLQRYPQLRPVGDVCAALCAVRTPMYDVAWTLFTRHDRGLVVPLAAQEYFPLGFRLDAATAAEALEQVLDGTLRLEAGAEVWVELAEASLAAGHPQLCAGALTRAEQGFDEAGGGGQLRARIATLQEFAARATRAREPVECPVGQVPFALVDYRHPDWRRGSTHLSDAIETLAVLGHLARHAGVRFTGPSELAACAERLRDQMTPARTVPGGSGTVRLYTVDRDASRYASVPEATWIIVSDWFAQPKDDLRFDMPLNPRLRPIFISFYIDVNALAAPGVVDYLRRYAPIGCLDWDTVFLLQSAGVPAFFSGALSATVDLAVEPAAPGGPVGDTVFLDAARGGAGRRGSLRAEKMRGRSLAANMAAAADALRGYRDARARVVTSDLRGYLAARAVGRPGTFRPEPGGGTLGGIAQHKGIADLGTVPAAEFAAMQHRITDKLATVLTAILAGHSDDEVYAVWREACAPDVAAATAALHAVEGYPKLTFDLDEACRLVRGSEVVMERTEPGPDGSEINLEFSLDGNYKHQLEVTLDSIVERCSRPIRAFLIYKGLDENYFEHIRRVFPTVSFVWLSTENVRFDPGKSGKVASMNSWVSAVSMDRNMLPALLPDVGRIVHCDLDAMCLADIAELLDVDMEGMAIAAVPEAKPHFVSGFETLRRQAIRLRRQGRPDLAREFTVRTHAQHEFDFDVFNAGLMVLDLDKMRADEFCSRYLPFVQTYGVNGQVVLNVYLGRGYKKLDPDWNRQMRVEMADTAKFAHWPGKYKPWAPEYVSHRELWREQEKRFAARTAALAADNAIESA